MDFLEFFNKQDDFTEPEIKEAQLLRDYLSQSGGNQALFRFLDKALKNDVSKKISQALEKSRAEDYEERKNSLIYVD